jgi:CheY-like chemotaxis protein
MDPVRATSAPSFAHRTVLVGSEGSVWPFVPRKLSGAFFFDYDPHRDVLVWGSGNSAEVLGMSESATTAHGAFLLAHVHSADRFRVESMLHESLTTSAPYVCTYRWIRPDTQETRVIHVRALLEADGSLFRGIVFDLSSEVPALQHNCDHLDAIALSMGQLGQTGLVVDADLRIRAIRGAAHSDRFSLGLVDFSVASLRPGAILSECFSDERSKEVVRELLAKAMSGVSEKRVWRGFGADIRPITSNDVVQGLVILVQERNTEEALEESLAVIETTREERTRYRSIGGTIVDLSQEILGFSALIARQATDNSLIRHAAGALLTTARMCGQKAQELLAPLQTPIPEGRSVVTKLPPRCDSVKALPPATKIVFASTEARTAQTFSVLLRGSGLPCSAVSFAEHDLREVLMKHNFIRVVILDITSEGRPGLTVIRKLRRFFPALHFVALVPGPIEDYEAFRRAGADLLISKPATARDIERVVKGLLILGKL